MNPALEAFVEVQHFYGRQCLAIDGGAAADWAALFVDDGVFDSPTYPAPVIGAAALEDFARTVHATSPHLHHVVTNVAIDDVGSDLVVVRANLVIVTTHDLASGAARVDRITTIHDRFRRVPELRLERRRVVRDGPPDPTDEGAPHD